MMLREIGQVRQVPAEPRRRWFADDYFDLIVWLDPNDEILGFQLCYDKCGIERALTWHRKTGFSHNQVDTGELERPYKATPILVSDGWFDQAAIAGRFKEDSGAMDAQVAEFVLEHLRRYHSAAEAE